MILTVPTSNSSANQCIRCHEARKPCSDTLPCERCISRGEAATCVERPSKRVASKIVAAQESSVEMPPSVILVPQPGIGGYYDTCCELLTLFNTI